MAVRSVRFEEDFLPFSRPLLRLCPQARAVAQSRKDPEGPRC